MKMYKFIQVGHQFTKNVRKIVINCLKSWINALFSLFQCMKMNCLGLDLGLERSSLGLGLMI